MATVGDGIENMPPAMKTGRRSGTQARPGPAPGALRAASSGREDDLSSDDDWGGLPFEKARREAGAARNSASDDESSASYQHGRASPAGSQSSCGLPSLPDTLPLASVLDAEATTALLVTWQFARCFCRRLQPDRALVTPTLEQLQDGLCSGGESGLVGELHIHLLRLFLEREDKTALIDDDSDGESTEVHRVPRPSTGVHAWLARDLAAYLDADRVGWPEVLRLVIAQWKLKEESKGSAVHDKDWLDPSLLELGRRLRVEEYSSIDATLKCQALGNLCERALEVLGSEIAEAWESLQQARRGEAKAVRELQREQQRASKVALAAARQRAADLGGELCAAEEDFTHTERAYWAAAAVQHESMVELKEAMDAARAVRDAARDAIRLAKEEVRTLQAGGATAASGSDEGASRRGRRISSKVEAAAQAEADRVAVQRAEWADMTRLTPLGRDAEGSVYWLLPGPLPPVDDHQGGQPLGPLLAVEHQGGGWGQLASLSLLKLALEARDLPGEAKLRRRLAEVTLPEDADDDGSGGPTAGGGQAKLGRTDSWDASHDWVGLRVRRIVKGETFNAVVSAWRPARGDGKPARWRLRFDDGDEEEVDEEGVAEAIEEAAEASLRAMRRRLLAVEATLLSGSSGAGEARSGPLRAPTASNAASWAEERRSWLLEVETAVDVAQLRALLLRMYDAVQTPVSSASDGGAADVEWSDAWHRELTQAWRRRVLASSTLAQLSLRFAEAQWNLHAQGGVVPGARLEVHCEASHAKKAEEGSVWRLAHVVAVFVDGSFRALWDESGRYQTRDFAAAPSRVGRKERGVVWRFLEDALPAKRRSSSEEAKSAEAAPPRVKRGRSAGLEEAKQSATAPPRVKRGRSFDV
ncbi:hypothetical protein EMIHUDRAFT_243657 [Emiliania huxleyi CCMP1516]|uniref:DDT domain-containing protein n=2 Tax=Emiliania huxleyi TaxID=2903 RepID=A0A0D3J526_EMIH1|nr:hypothetical protein EMIHUDRAFT_212477 [Emiliania huxleyi CCMP1516]XP_005771040.1 hypothetical protein EMIHUDRAFT_243657 [Emiliania huxleyi CCMP1516]EOD13906.1 hypothetical protein EMIHUDRAFT_212477 [Emiliania huxleyi CCMP1516]EOD18611.1 hypothetical protein EMIHUDRAFT_243657 [Emiliania huxleyi CCMP1516]|eukprot:XP_005766335.1 hypothetical protein EMIHUDRAFT_212477 [Emiliania huxleyi CCMP1516]